MILLFHKKLGRLVDLVVYPMVTKPSTVQMQETFVDTKKLPIHKKQVRPLEQQGELESRRLWKDVTLNLKAKNVDKATEFKHGLEQRQREEAKQRKG